MPGYSYYEPDLHLLNKKARLKRIKRSNGITALFNHKAVEGYRKIPPPEKNRRLKQLAEAIEAAARGIDWQQNLNLAPCVVFDTETTGLKPLEGDEVTSIGAVLIKNEAIDESNTFYRLVNPGRPQSQKAFEITGLSDEMLKKGVGIYSALVELIEFTGPCVMIAHSASFDLTFFNLKLGPANTRIMNPVIDTALLAAALLPANSNFSLEGLASRYKISLADRHNSLGDARIAAKIYFRLLHQLDGKKAASLPGLARLLSGLNPQKGYPSVY